MTRLSFVARTGLTLFVLPFFIGGILLASVVYSWLYESLSGDSRALLFPCFVILATTGIFFGALIGYGVLIFLLSWFAPRSPLLIQAEVEKPGWILRLLLPAFNAVRKIAQSLVPRHPA